MSRCLSLAGPDYDREGDPPGIDSRVERGFIRARALSRELAASIVPLLPRADESADTCSAAWEAAQVALLAAEAEFHAHQPAATVRGMVLHAIRAGVSREALADAMEPNRMPCAAQVLRGGADELEVLAAMRQDFEALAY